MSKKSLEGREASTSAMASAHTSTPAFIRLHPSDADPTLDIHDYIHLLLYIGDILPAYSRTIARDAADRQGKLVQVYKIIDLCTPHQFLRIEIHYEYDSPISLILKVFINFIFQRFHMEKAYSHCNSTG
jgi:hypothetical protein